jgi:3-hydroxyisobutyrate dehydrogenase
VAERNSPDSPVRTVAVLGTGTMGAPIARNLAGAGLEVRAWNRTAEKARPLADHGIAVAPSAAEAVAGADAVLTMLADGSAVEAVMGSDGHALEAIGDGAAWLQASTVGIDSTGRLSRMADECGVPFADMPVLGTKEPAEQGQLVVLGSGPEELQERCRPVVEAIASRTYWLGPVGAGTRMKLVLNGWLLTLVAGLAETVAFAEALGVDPRRFLDVIDGGPVGPPYAKLKGNMMIERSFEPSFPLKLAEKDAALVLDAAAAAGLRLEVDEAVRRALARAGELGYRDADLAAVFCGVVRARG